MKTSLTDEELLARVLDEHAEEIAPKEFEAFESMRERLQEGWMLSDKQRSWIQGVAERLRIQVAGARNLFSKMPKHVQAEHRRKVKTQLPWETGSMTKPLKPPGRS